MLTRNRKPGAFQLFGEKQLVHGFQQPRTDVLMNPYGRADSESREIIFGMHGLGAEEGKEDMPRTAFSRRRRASNKAQSTTFSRRRESKRQGAETIVFRMS